MSNLSRLLRERRAELGLSQGQVAAAVGTHQPNISSYENGVVPSLSRLWQLAVALDLPASDILSSIAEDAQAAQTVTDTHRAALLWRKATGEATVRAWRQIGAEAAKSFLMALSGTEEAEAINGGASDE